MITDFLKSNSPLSSLRLGMTAIIIGSVTILISMSIYILYFGFNKIEISRWTDMGIFLGGLATLITGVLYNKVQQKKLEINENGTN